MPALLGKGLSWQVSVSSQIRYARVGPRYVVHSEGDIFKTTWVTPNKVGYNVCHVAQLKSKSAVIKTSAGPTKS